MTPVSTIESQTSYSTLDDKSSIICHEQCIKGCSGPSASECHECKNFRNGSKGPCVAVCPSRFYGNPETGECYPCDTSCQVCSGPLRTSCTTCKDGYHLTSKGVCSKICHDGFFVDPKENDCKSCQAPCSTCKMSAQNCTSCLVGHRLAQGQCIQNGKCAPNQYTVDGGCISCFRLCATCHGPSSSQCSSCPPNFVISNGSCAPASCSAGFYQDVNGGSNSPICKRCHRFCLMCKGPSSFECLTCRPTYKMVNRNCIKDILHISCDENQLCLNQTTKAKPFQKDNANTLIILSVLFGIFTLILIATAAIIYYAQSNNKLCWAYRYQKVVVLFDENTNRFLLTNGDSGDEDEEKFEIK